MLKLEIRLNFFRLFSFLFILDRSKNGSDSPISLPENSDIFSARTDPEEDVSGEGG